MTKARSILFVLVAGLLLAGPVGAQAAETVHELEVTGRGVIAPIEDPQLKMMIFDALDAEGEGVITKEEFEQGAEITIDTRQFDALDANNDGVLDRQEFMNVQIQISDRGQEGPATHQREMGADQETQPQEGTEGNQTGQ